MSVSDPSLREAFRPFERRAMFVAFGKAFSMGLLAVALIVEIAALFGLGNWLAASVLVVMTALASVVYATAQRPTALALARRVDARAGLNDLLVTAIESTNNGIDDGMPAMVRRASLAALATESAKRAYPFEAPRHWRRWLIVAGAVQLVALPMAFRAPAARPTQAGLTSLTLPATPGGSNAGAQPDQRKAVSEPAAGPSAATKQERAQSLRAGSLSPSDKAPANGRADEGSGGDARLRLAATNAEAEIAAGRVPLARRAIVERYFAAIQSQGKRPR